MIKTLLLSLTLACTIFSSLAYGFRLPEIGFCPAGGPPGWFNRMTGQNNRYYGPPPPPMYRPVYPASSPNWQVPARQQAPLYFPVKR